MITLYSIMFLIFWGYVGFIVAKYGILPSLSDSYYQLPVSIRDIVFTLVFYATGVMAIILGECGLMFAAGVGICLVGTAPQFKDSYVKKIHFVGAGAAALFSQLYILFVVHLWPITAALGFFGLLFYLLKVKNLIWWLEMLCFISTFIALGIITL